MNQFTFLVGFPHDRSDFNIVDVALHIHSAFNDYNFLSRKLLLEKWMAKKVVITGAHRLLGLSSTWKVSGFIVHDFKESFFCNVFSQWNVIVTRDTSPDEYPLNILFHSKKCNIAEEKLVLNAISWVFHPCRSFENSPTSLESFVTMSINSSNESVELTQPS